MDHHFEGYEQISDEGRVQFARAVGCGAAPPSLRSRLSLTRARASHCPQRGDCQERQYVPYDGAPFAPLDPVRNHIVATPPHDYRMPIAHLRFFSQAQVFIRFFRPQVPALAGQEMCVRARDSGQPGEAHRDDGASGTKSRLRFREM